MLSHVCQQLFHSEHCVVPELWTVGSASQNGGTMESKEQKMYKSSTPSSQHVTYTLPLNFVNYTIDFKQYSPIIGITYLLCLGSCLQLSKCFR